MLSTSAVMFLMHLMLTEIKQLKCIYWGQDFSPATTVGTLFLHGSTQLQLRGFGALLRRVSNRRDIMLSSEFARSSVLAWLYLWPLVERCLHDRKGKIGKWKLFYYSALRQFVFSHLWVFLTVFLITPWKLEPLAWNWLHGYLIAISLCKLELYSLSLLFPKHSGASAWAFPWILGSISGGEFICNDIHSWNHQLYDLSLLNLLERSSSSPISLLKNTTVGSFSTFHLSDNFTSHLENYRDIFLPLSSFYNSSLGVWVYVGSCLCLARDYLP